MSDKKSSGWTVDTLKVHYDEIMAEHAHNLTLALAASEKAVEKAEAAVTKRLDGMNEFREALRDQTLQFVSRNEALVQHQGIIERVEAVGRIDEAARQAIEDKHRVLQATVFGLVPRDEWATQHQAVIDKLELAVERGSGEVSKVENSVQALISRFDRRDGEQAGATANAAKLIAIIMALGTIITVVTVLLANHVLH